MFEHARWQPTQCCNRACKSRGETMRDFRLPEPFDYRSDIFNVEIPIQKVKFVFEDAVDEQFAELSKHFA